MLGNGVRLFPACAKAPARGPLQGTFHLQVRGLEDRWPLPTDGTGFQAGSPNVVKSSVSPDSA